MALIDYHESDEYRCGPRLDSLGLSFFLSHLLVGTYILFGWIVSSPPALAFYLLLLPAVSTQWYINRGSCVMNNLETRLRNGRWRDPANPEEGRFLLMLCHWLFGVRPHPSFSTGSPTRPSSSSGSWRYRASRGSRLPVPRR